eukprot:1317011-Ditylum_brightwellii.AAC.1
MAMALEEKIDTANTHNVPTLLPSHHREVVLEKQTENRDEDNDNNDGEHDGEQPASLAVAPPTIFRCIRHHNHNQMHNA